MADKRTLSSPNTKSTQSKILVLGEEKTLRELENMVIENFQDSIKKGIVANTEDIEEYLEYLTRKDNDFDDQIFIDTVSKLSKILLKEGTIYKDGDSKSYQERVSSKGFISQKEYNMLENLANPEEDNLSVAQLEEIISKNGPVSIRFIDTEFPVNNKTGRYDLTSH